MGKAAKRNAANRMLDTHEPRVGDLLPGTLNPQTKQASVPRRARNWPPLPERHGERRRIPMDTPKPQNPAATLSAGYASSADPKAARRRRSLAALWQRDDRLDALLALRDRDRAAFEKMVDPGLRTALGTYTIAKAAYEEEHPHGDSNDR